jgi:hypothetical protein
VYKEAVHTYFSPLPPQDALDDDAAQNLDFILPCFNSPLQPSSARENSKYKLIGDDRARSSLLTSHGLSHSPQNTVTSMANQPTP